MTKDEVIALARQAEGEEQQHGMWRMHVEDLERFAALVAAHEQKAKPITNAEMSAWVKDTWEKCQAEAWQEPSGSFVLWQNTLCNPLSDPIFMTHSAWHDGYASGVKAEREACAKVCEDEGERVDASWMSCAAAIRSRT